MQVTVISPEPGHPDRDRLRRIGRKVRKRLAANQAVQRLDVANAELWAIANFLDAIECGRLIQTIDSVARPSTTYLSHYSSGFRTSYSGNFDPFDPFVAKLEQRLDDLLGLDSAQAEPIEGQRYTAGQEFKPHIDWFQEKGPAWAYEKDLGGQRSYTAMAFLNAVEAGGETDFPRLGIAIEPRPGTLLVWNNADEDGVPNPWTIHAGNPVERGTKYIFTRWYRCRRPAVPVPNGPAPRR
jgi:prolyl 4-hydroxylase